MTDLAALRPAFDRLKAGNPARRLTFGFAERRKALARLGQVVRDHRDAIAAAVAADMGKHPVEADLVEVMPVLSEISHCQKHLRGWMRRRAVWPTLLMLGTSAALHPEPKGVALVIAPWNFPFLLALAPVISAIAAGNAVMVKPSELTPATSALIARLLPLALPDLAQVIEGGADVAQALLDMPFDHIFFTGSPAVGKIVLAAAAKNLAPVTLELGGKSPVVVGADADLAQAAKWVAWGKGLNAGQICVAPDHVYVHETVMENFRSALRAAFAKSYGRDAGASPDLTHIVNDRHFARLSGLLEDALRRGATVEALGKDDPSRQIMAPKLITGTTPEMAISTDEIFGPLLPLIPYRNLTEVVAAINAGPKPLTLYAFGGGNLVGRLRDETSSGSVGVNLTVMPFIHANLPFGGVGNSGMGAGHGKAGFDTFSHLKPVLKNRFTLLPMLFPPYSAKVRRLKNLVLQLVK
ncbi:MAG: aldehyde dehydrogenase family protein [Rhodobacteraceae bacterium]|nr:aldehyde dehydrogenase family protein [Paracoccaceae bacterium]